MTILTQALADILTKNMSLTTERILLIYDRESELSSILADAYLEVFTSLENLSYAIDFHAHTSEQIIERMFSLPPESIVILVQSTNFRLSEFRIRLELFNKNINCVEHNHLGYIPSEQFDTFTDALRYRGSFYQRAYAHLKPRIELSKEITVEGEYGAILRFGPMEAPRPNIGDYSEMPHRG